MDEFKKLFSKGFWHFTQFKQKSDCQKILNKIERLQWASHDELHNIQWNKLKNLLAYAELNIPYYQEMFKKIGGTANDIKTYEDFLKIPIISKTDIKENLSLMLNNKENREGVYPNSTGGSTGQPLQLYQDKMYANWNQAATILTDSWAGADIGDKQALLWGASFDLEKQRGNWKTLLSSKIFRVLMLDAFNLGEKTLEDYAEKIAKFKPKVLTGYTSALIVFAKFIKKRGITNIGPYAVRSTAEKLFDEQRQILSDIFNCHIFDRYGGREVGCIAHDCEMHQGLHVMVFSQYLEIISNNKPVNNNESGEIVITNLNNYTMPFIRYKIKDLGKWGRDKCPCGRGLKLMHISEGRIADILIGEGGKMVPGEFFPHLLKEVNLKYYQVHQKSTDLLTIKIVPSEKYSGEDKAFIENNVKRVFGDNVTIEILLVDKIEKTKSGKFRVTRSDIAEKYLRTIL